MKLHSDVLQILALSLLVMAPAAAQQKSTFVIDGLEPGKTYEFNITEVQPGASPAAAPAPAPAPAVASGPPAMTSPAPGGTLAGPDVEFTWFAGAENALEWFFRAGSQPKGSDLIDQRIKDAAARSYKARGLPTDGSTVYVTLSYRNADGWQGLEYEYKSAIVAGTAATRATQRARTVSASSHDWGTMQAVSPFKNPIAKFQKDALVFEIDNTTRLKNMTNFGEVGCEGIIINIDVPANKDAVIRMAPGVESIDYPIWVTGGKSHLFVGIHLHPITQPGCGIGESTVRGSNTFPNVNRYIPVSGIGIRSQASHVTWIEGSWIDLDGAEADCIVLRNNEGSTDSNKHIAKEQREFYLVNSRCTGIESLDKSMKYTGNGVIIDGIHGDVVQNQGTGAGSTQEPVGLYWFENVSMLSAGNFIQHHHTRVGGRLRLLKLINSSFEGDPDHYTRGKDPYDGGGIGPIFYGMWDKAEFTNVWTKHPTGLNYGVYHKGKSYGGSGRNGSMKGITKTAGINVGKAPKVMAPEGAVGRFYKSPYREHEGLM